MYPNENKMHSNFGVKTLLINDGFTALYRCSCIKGAISVYSEYAQLLDVTVSIKLQYVDLFFLLIYIKSETYQPMK